MKKVTSFSVAAIMLLTSCNSGGNASNGDGSISLKFNFQKGSKYKYVMKTRYSITQEMMGKSITASQDIDMGSTYEVAGAEGNNKKLTVTYDRIAMHSNNSAVNISYDSDDSIKSSPELRSLGAMVHKPFSMTVDEKGQIVAIEGFRDLMPGGNSGITDSSLRSMMQQAFYIYPDKPVKPGDTWSNRYTTSLGFMELSTDNSYKLTSVNNGVAHVEMTSKIGANQNSGQTKEMKMEITGTQTGGMDIDVSTGLMVGSVLSQKISGSIDMMNMKAPIQVTSDISVAGTKIK